MCLQFAWDAEVEEKSDEYNVLGLKNYGQFSLKIKKKKKIVANPVLIIASYLLNVASGLLTFVKSLVTVACIGALNNYCLFAGERPSATIDPDRQEVAEGHTGTLRCVVTGEPKPTVTWARARGELSANHQVSPAVGVNVVRGGEG